MVGLDALTIFYLFISIVTLVFSYLYDDDLWLKGLLIIFFVFTFGFFVNHSYNSFMSQSGFHSDQDIITWDGYDFENPVIVGQELLSSSTLIDAAKFSNIPTMKEGLYTMSEFCFLYNNTDASNVIRITNKAKPVSEYIYLFNQTTGIECAHIPNNLTYDSVTLGIICEDCSQSNKLGLPLVQGSQVQHIELSVNNPSTYTIRLKTPNYYYLELRSPPTSNIKDNFFLYLTFVGAMLLSIIFRLIIIFIIKVKELTT